MEVPMAEKAKTKRRRGRPRRHGANSAVVSVRASKEQVVRIAGLISAIRLGDQTLEETDASVIVEALECRVRQLANRAPQVLKLAGLQ
jgi:hypothetical protein